MMNTIHKLEPSEFTKSVIVFLCCFIRPYIASVNTVVITVLLYLLWALDRRIIVYCVLSKIQNLDDAQKRVYQVYYTRHGTLN